MPDHNTEIFGLIRSMEAKISHINTEVAKAQTKITTVCARVERMDQDKVSRDAHKPVAWIAYGLAGSVLSSIVAAVLVLVVGR